jgi:glycosyltransferase involved in cell wall biosynthesis
MRIGIDVDCLAKPYRSGLYVYVWNLLKGLQQALPRGPVSLLVSQHFKDGCAARLKEGFPSWPLRTYPRPRRAYKLRMRLSAFGRAHVFHCPAGPAPFRVPWSSRATVVTIPDLTVVHYRDCHTPAALEWWLPWFDVAAKHADMIVCYSEHTRQDIVRTLGISADRIMATPLAAGGQFRTIGDRRQLATQLAAFGLRDRGYVLSVGTLEPRKNQCGLIRAYARMVRKNPGLPHQLVFAGGRGWLEEPVFEAARQAGLGDRIVFLGHSDPLEVLYNGAALLAYPSFYEGFGLPPLEAMACGTPVVASNRSSLPEVVGDAGLMVGPDDEEALCEAMTRALHDERLRAELVEKGLRRAATFTWERTARATLAAYRAAYDRTKQRARAGA